MIVSLTEILYVLASVFHFWDDVKNFLKLREQYSDDQWKNEGQILTKAIKGAATDEERKALLQRLSNHIGDA